MDNKYFRQEIKEYIDERYNKFCEYQRVALDILIEFDRVCSNNHLDYYLAYGSLIGAIRDNSQIPWDYDIDTLIKIDDKNKLLYILDKNLNHDYYYDYTDKSPTYPTSCLRIGKKGYNLMAIHVDVFFLIGTPNNAQTRIKFIGKANNFMKMKTRKFINLYLPQNNRFGGIRSLIYSLIPNSWFRRKEKKLFYKYPLTNSLYWITSQTVYKIAYPKEIFESTTKIKVNNYWFPAPIGYEQFLNINYGDWRLYYPIQNRFEEFYKMCNVVEKRLRTYE